LGLYSKAAGPAGSHNVLQRLRAFLIPLVAAAVLALPAPVAPPPSGAIPARVLLTWAGDPATTQAVTWRTGVLRPSPQIQFARLDPDPAFEKAATSVPGTAATKDLGDGRSVHHYSANLQGLTPGTKYCYRVGDGQVWSEWNAFRTAAAKPEPFRFLYVGDAQNSVRSLWSRAIRAAYAAAPDARFIVHAGDLVEEGWDDSLWGEWCDALGFIGATIPSVPVVGNHDLHRAPVAGGGPKPKLVLTVAPPWHWHFALPANGPDLKGMESQSYYIDYQGVRLIVLDVNAFAVEDSEPEDGAHVREQELSWLTKILAANPNRWTIVAQHQGIYSIAHDRNYAQMRAALAPLYEKYGVDLVLQGHDHSYARSHKIAAGKIVDPSAAGVIYAISVSGPKMYQTHAANRELMAKIVEQKQFYQVVEVSPDRLVYKAYSTDGAVADRFELRKSEGHSTYLDGVPAKTL
jgi:phosphodiesterase/alkaline phosphatase D-like protein